MPRARSRRSFCLSAPFLTALLFGGEEISHCSAAGPRSFPCLSSYGRFLVERGRPVDEAAGGIVSFILYVASAGNDWELKYVG